MNLLTKMLAVDLPKDTQLSSWELSFRGLPIVWLILLFLVILGGFVGVAFFYANEKGTLGWIRRILLIGLRWALLLILLFLILRPVLLAEFVSTHSVGVALLIDNTQSMQLRDRRLTDADKTRVGIVLGMLPLDTDDRRQDARGPGECAERSAAHRAGQGRSYEHRTSTCCRACKNSVRFARISSASNCAAHPTTAARKISPTKSSPASRRRKLAPPWLTASSRFVQSQRQRSSQRHRHHHRWAGQLQQVYAAGSRPALQGQGQGRQGTQDSAAHLRRRQLRGGAVAIERSSALPTRSSSKTPCRPPALAGPGLQARRGRDRNQARRQDHRQEEAQAADRRGPARRRRLRRAQGSRQARRARAVGDHQVQGRRRDLHRHHQPRGARGRFQDTRFCTSRMCRAGSSSSCSRRCRAIAASRSITSWCRPTRRRRGPSTRNRRSWRNSPRRARSSSSRSTTSSFSAMCRRAYFSKEQQEWISEFVQESRRADRDGGPAEYAERV